MLGKAPPIQENQTMRVRWKRGAREQGLCYLAAVEVQASQIVFRERSTLVSSSRLTPKA